MYACTFLLANAVYPILDTHIHTRAYIYMYVCRLSLTNTVYSPGDGKVIWKEKRVCVVLSALVLRMTARMCTCMRMYMYVSVYMCGKMGMYIYIYIYR